MKIKYLAAIEKFQKKKKWSLLLLLKQIQVKIKRVSDFNNNVNHSIEDHRYAKKLIKSNVFNHF